MVNKGFTNIPVRFFVYDEEGDETDFEEVDEYDFLKAPGELSYERHTVFENGVSQIILTKG